MTTFEETFGEDRVNEWAEGFGVDIFGERTFGETIVPNVMLLSPLTNQVQQFHGDDVIITDLTAFRFRDPVLIGETVEYELELADERQNYDSISFELRVNERDSLVATGTLSVTTR